MRKLKYLTSFQAGFLTLGFAVLCGCGQGNDHQSGDGKDESNLATLKGIDANNNGVRDEVEEAIIKSYGSNTPITNAGMALAKSYQTWFDQKDASADTAKTLVLEELRLSRCLSRLNTAGLALETATTEIQIRTFNTRQRMQVRSQILETAGAFVLPSESAECLP